MFYAFKTVLPKVWESNGLIKTLFVKQGDGYNEAWHNWNGRQERLLPVAIIKWSIWLTFKLFCTNIYKLELGSLNPIRSPWIFLFPPFFSDTDEWSLMVIGRTAGGSLVICMLLLPFWSDYYYTLGGGLSLAKNTFKVVAAARANGSWVAWVHTYSNTDCNVDGHFAQSFKLI